MGVHIQQGIFETQIDMVCYTFNFWGDPPFYKHLVIHPRKAFRVTLEVKFGNKNFGSGIFFCTINDT